ncbi:YsnF/AvaK domain-containing protein [Neolewinella marina]|uniref:DUF2382 domain-containing protein n=1 Tax=Neolewinella marina TaxID=438751 RepID=A0A2G0CIG7_9BACT|nr:DUF2382 domain-containing protein [Neolewinella marina]PHK99717.1 hypothetical protein CGL56_01315 [Neolewinella marina]
MTDDDERHEKEGINKYVTPDETTVPVVEERLRISSQPTVTGEVRVEKRVATETVEVPLTTIETTYREQRIPANRVVDQMPRVRFEGENLIIPVVREEEVVTKRLVLVEEIHLTPHREVTERKESVPLRSEKVTISREKPGSAPA